MKFSEFSGQNFYYKLVDKNARKNQECGGFYKNIKPAYLIKIEFKNIFMYFKVTTIVEVTVKMYFAER